MRIDRILALGVATSALLVTTGVLAQQKEIKIGLIFDQTGPFAGGGSVAAQLGSKYAIDITNERRGRHEEAIRLIRSSPTLSQKPMLP